MRADFDPRVDLRLKGDDALAAAEQFLRGPEIAGQSVTCGGRQMVREWPRMSPEHNCVGDNASQACEASP